MKKLFLIFILTFTTSFAQDIFRVGFGANGVFPVGDFSKYSTNSVGTSFYTEYEIDENITANVVVLLNKFDAKINLNNSKVEQTISTSSLMLGLQYKLINNLSLSLAGGMNYTRLPKEYYNSLYSDIELSHKTEAYNIISFGLKYRSYLSKYLSIVFSSNYSLVNGHLSNFNNFNFDSTLFVDLDL